MSKFERYLCDETLFCMKILQLHSLIALINIYSQNIIMVCNYEGPYVTIIFG